MRLMPKRTHVSQSGPETVLRPVLAALGVSLLGALSLSSAGCFTDDNRARFYTYCDTGGCYQCDVNGCRRMQGLPPGAVCRGSADCAPGCYCGADGKCAEAGFCDKPGDCARGYVCDTARHSCVPANGGGGGTNPTPQACQNAADCASGAECMDGRCQVGPVLPNHCVFNRECGTGGVCTDGRCEKACQGDGACGTGRVCTEGRCIPKAPGDASACRRTSDCGAGLVCLNGTCHPSCTKDSECQARNAKDVCLQGLCRPDESRVPECRQSSDCGAGRECVDSLCRAPCYASSDCAQCADGPVCVLGHCATQREASPGCKLGPDCGQSGRCTDGLCVR